MKLIPEWAEALTCAVTICDKEGVIIFMNERSRQTFGAHGDLIGKNLFDYHKPSSQAKIRHMLATGEDNTYRVIKNGVSKIIHQTPWRIEGEIAGMVEISIILHDGMKTVNRDLEQQNKQRDNIAGF